MCVLLSDLSLRTQLSSCQPFLGPVFIILSPTPICLSTHLWSHLSFLGVGTVEFLSELHICVPYVCASV